MTFLQNLEPSKEMINWCIFNVVIPLLPVVLVFLIGWMMGKFQNLFAIIRDGQLCFYCTATAASLIKDLAGKTTTSTIAVGGIIIVILFSMGFYGAAVATPKTPDDTKKFGGASICLCLATIVLVVFVRNKERLL